MLSQLTFLLPITSPPSKDEFIYWYKPFPVSIVVVFGFSFWMSPFSDASNSDLIRSFSGDKES